MPYSRTPYVFPSRGKKVNVPRYWPASRLRSRARARRSPAPARGKGPSIGESYCEAPSDIAQHRDPTGSHRSRGLTGAASARPRRLTLVDALPQHPEFCRRGVFLGCALSDVQIAQAGPFIHFAHHPEHSTREASVSIVGPIRQDIPRLLAPLFGRTPAPAIEPLIRICTAARWFIHFVRLISRAPHHQLLMLHECDLDSHWAGQLPMVLSPPRPFADLPAIKKVRPYVWLPKTIPLLNQKERYRRYIFNSLTEVRPPSALWDSEFRAEGLPIELNAPHRPSSGTGRKMSTGDLFHQLREGHN